MRGPRWMYMNESISILFYTSCPMMRQPDYFKLNLLPKIDAYNRAIYVNIKVRKKGQSLNEV